MRDQEEGNVQLVQSCCQDSLSASGKGGHGTSPVLEPEEQTWPAVINSTFKNLWEFGEGKRGGGELMGSKVEGMKSRPVWEEKTKGERGRESQCKEKVIAPPCKLSQASCRPTE